MWWHFWWKWIRKWRRRFLHTNRYQKIPLWRKSVFDLWIKITGLNKILYALWKHADIIQRIKKYWQSTHFITEMQQRYFGFYWVLYFLWCFWRHLSNLQKICQIHENMFWNEINICFNDHWNLKPVRACFGCIINKISNIVSLEYIHWHAEAVIMEF